MIISKTPLRVSLVGGGTDIPAFYEKSPGAVVSFSIDKYVYVTVNDKFDGHFRVSYSETENVGSIYDIKHDLVRQALWQFQVKKGLEIVSVADIPGEGTGLGSSSAFTVGLINALNYHYQQDYLSPGVLAELAFKVESGPHPDIGKQDAYAAAYGDFNFMHFTRNSVEVTPLVMDEEVEKWFLLLYTGITRSSVELLREQRKALEGKNFEIGKGMARLAEEFTRKYYDGDLNIGELLHENWLLKSCIAPGISNFEIDEWYRVARENGAEGGKLCGAGGGGFMLFYAPPDSHRKIAEATGLRRVEFKIAKEGSRVIYG